MVAVLLQELLSVEQVVMVMEEVAVVLAIQTELRVMVVTVSLLLDTQYQM